MRPTTRRYLVTGAALLGSLVLFGLPTFVAVVGATTLLGEAFGLALDTAGPTGLLLWALGAGAALAVATEAAAVRLDGAGALHRGTRRQRTVRYLTLALVALAVVVLVGSFLRETAAWALANGRVEYLVLLGAVGLAVTWVVRRTAQAFRQGYRDRGRSEGSTPAR